MTGIKFKQYIFKPALIPSIITVALLYLMISLAMWQLDRADYKANLQSIIESRQDLNPVPLDSAPNNQDDWLYLPVTTAGTFDTEHQFFLDNQVNNMTAGYSVFTPLKLSDNHAILVNRGWLAQGNDRNRLPDITINQYDAAINYSGLLANPPSAGLVLSSDANSYKQWPAVLQYIDITEIQKHLDYELKPMVLVLNKVEQTPFEILPIKVNMRSEKHTAYAFQWFALSFALLIIYIIVNSKKQN